VLSDRLCIASGGKIKVALSSEDLMACWVSALYNHGCDGGVPEYAWKYATTSGIVSEACFPFTNASAKNGTTPACEISAGACPGGGQQEYRKYKAQEGTVTVITQAPWAAQQAMVDHGTLTASFTVFEDFLSYKSGVYKHVNGSALGKHAVRLVGYGIDNTTGVHYWSVANSWGKSHSEAVCSSWWEYGVVSRA
jgi:cathepsin B